MTDILPPTTDVSTMRHADLPAIWDDFAAKLTALKTTAETLTVTDAGQLLEMRQARETRLALRQIRIAVEHKRKELTDYHLKTKQEIDACAKWLKDKLEPLEERLLYQEEFSKRAEEARRLHLAHAREEALQPFGVDVTTLAALDGLSEEAFAGLLESSRLAHEARQAEALRLAEEAAKRDAAAAEERRQLQADNDRLRAERTLLEAQQAEQRQRLAELAAKKAKELEVAQAELDRKAKEEFDRLEAERKAQAEKEAAEIRARQAPDRDKLTRWLTNLRDCSEDTKPRDMSTAKGQLLLAAIDKAFAQLLTNAQTNIDAL